MAYKGGSPASRYGDAVERDLPVPWPTVHDILLGIGRGRYFPVRKGADRNATSADWTRTDMWKRGCFLVVGVSRRPGGIEGMSCGMLVVISICGRGNSLRTKTAASKSFGVLPRPRKQATLPPRRPGRMPTIQGTTDLQVQGGRNAGTLSGWQPSSPIVGTLNGRAIQLASPEST